MTYLDKCLKTTLQDTVQQTTCQRVTNTADVCTTTDLSSSSITEKEMELENVSLSTEILGPFVNILTADDKYFLRNSENLR